MRMHCRCQSSYTSTKNSFRDVRHSAVVCLRVMEIHYTSVSSRIFLVHKTIDIEITVIVACVIRNNLWLAISGTDGRDTVCGFYLIMYCLRHYNTQIYMNGSESAFG